MQFGMSRLNVRRIAAIVVSSLTFAALLGIGLVAKQGDTAFASSWLPYHRGYYTTQGWMCYGWSNGTWHCTSHWYRTNGGILVSQNVAWVPNNLDQPTWTNVFPDNLRDGVPLRNRARKPVAPAPKSVAPAPKPVVRPAPPVTRPAPPPAPSVGQQAVINDIYAVFGANAGAALNIARCESGFNPYAVNPIVVLGSHAEGVFQILYPSTWNTTSYAGQSPYNYDANIHAAYQIFARDGFSWREWQCRP